MESGNSRQARSPYQRYQKVPYRYSPTYYAWRAAVINQDEGRTREARAAHDAYLRREAPFPADERLNKRYHA